MKQTAVEWFATKLLNEVSKSDTMAIAKFWEIVEQAKAIEREQRIADFKAGCVSGYEESNLSTEDLFNEYCNKIDKV